MSIEETSSYVVELYRKLSDPACEETAAITSALTSFYSQPESFSILFHIVVTNNDNTIRNSAVIGMRMFLVSTYLNVPNKPEIYEIILKLSVFEASREVRELNKRYLTTCMSLEMIPVINEFLASIAQEMTIIHAESICNIAVFSMSYAESTERLTFIDPEIEEAAISLGMTSSSIYTKLSVVRLVLHKLNLQCDGENYDEEKASHFFKAALELLKEAAEKNEVGALRSLVSDVFNYAVDNESPFVEVQDLMNVAISIMQTSNYSKVARMIVQELCDLIIINNEEIVMNEGFGENTLPVMIFNSYLSFASETISADDIFTLSDHNVFSSVAPVFSKNEDFLNFFWEIVNGQIEDESTMFVILTVLIYTFENGARFYKDKMAGIGQLINTCLQSENVCTVTAALSAITQMSECFGESISDVSNNFIEGILGILSEDHVYSMELVTSLYSILDQSKNTDPYFTPVAEVLISLISSGSSAHLCLQCFSSLIKHSENGSKEHFGSLLQLFNEIIQSSEESQSVLKSAAILCLSNLGKKNEETFMEYAQQYATFFIGFLESNDDQIVYESIRAIGRLIESYTEDFSDFVDQALVHFIEIASIDLTPRDVPEAEFMGDDDVELDVEYNLLLQKVGASIRIACLILSYYPEKIDKFLERIMSQMKNVAAQCSLIPSFIKSIAEAAGFLSNGLIKNGRNQQQIQIATQLIGIIVPSLSNLLDHQVIGKVLESICDIFSNFTPVALLPYNEEVITAVKSSLTENTETYIEGFHECAQRILRELMDQMHSNCFEIISPFIEIFQGLLSHSDTRFRELSLQFFGDLLSTCPDRVDEEFARTVLVIAIDVISKNNTPLGFTAIKQIANTFPNALSGKKEEILNEIEARLNLDLPKTDEVMALQDNAVSALGQIVMHVSDGSFPIDRFAVIALSAMPAQVEVEENPDILKFFIWILNNTGDNYIIDICKVFVRLFSDDPVDIVQWCITEDQIEHLRKIFQQIIGKVGDVEAFIQNVTEGDEYKFQKVVEALQ